jgi:hypothetical protein
MRSTDGDTIVVQPSPMMIFDTPLNKHTYCAWAETTIDSTNLDIPSGTWPADKWVYVYAYSENRVGKIEASETAPAVIMPAVGVSTSSKVFKTGDESRKYLGCFYSDGSSIVRRFRMADFEYVNLDQVINDVFDKLLDRDQAVETRVRRTLYHYDLDGVGQVTVACPRCHQLHPWMVGPSAAAYGLCPCGTTLHLPYDPKFTFDVTLFENPANVLSVQTLCNLCRGSELFPISSVGNDDRFSEFIRCNYCGGRLRHTSGSRPLILTPEIVNVVALDSSPGLL